MMNGAAIVNTSKKHSTVDVSTTAAELTELFNCALNIALASTLLCAMDAARC